MVDFNAGATVAVPAYDVLKILILEKREAFLGALEAYYRTKYKGVAVNHYELRARLMSLFNELAPAIEADKSKEYFIQLKENVQGKKFEELEAGWNTINEWLYEKQLTKWDSKIRYDSTSAERENSIKGV